MTHLHFINHERERKRERERERESEIFDVLVCMIVFAKKFYIGIE